MAGKNPQQLHPDMLPSGNYTRQVPWITGLPMEESSPQSRSRGDVVPVSSPNPEGANMGPAMSPEASLDATRPTGRIPGQIEYGIDDVTPEEQQQYDKIVNKIGKMAYGQSSDAIIDMLNNENTPVYKVVASTAFMMLDQVVNSAEQEGFDLSADAIFHAGTETVEVLMDLGSAAGIWGFEEGGQEYTQQQETAFVELQKIIGEGMLAGEDSDSLRLEAEDNLTTRIGMEADAGALDPNFQKSVAGMAANPGLNTGGAPRPPVSSIIPGVSGVTGGPQRTPVAQGVRQSMAGGRAPPGAAMPPGRVS